MGTTIKFSPAHPGLGCVSTAYSSWIAHEYGHVILSRLDPSGFGFGMGEAFADSLAILIYNDPCWGKGLYVEGPDDCYRDHDSSEDTRYPCELPGHECATLLGGVWWDIKELLEDKYNNMSPYGEEDCPSAFFPAGHDPDISTGEKCGLEVTRQLFTNWSQMTGGGLGEQNAHSLTLWEVLSVDYDHDGDPDTLTLHDTRIWAGFRIHNIPPVLERPRLPGSPEHQARKHRYLSIDATTNLPYKVAIKVEVAEMRRCQNAPTRACLVDTDCDDVCNDVAGPPPYHTLKCPPADCSATNPPSECIWSGPCVDLAPTFDPPLTWFVQEPEQNPQGCRAPECDHTTENCCGPEDWFARVAAPDEGRCYGDEQSTCSVSDQDCTDEEGPPCIVYSEDWSASEVLHIGDCPIVPCVTYKVYACDWVFPTVCSDPLEVATQRFPENARPTAFPLYGDVCGGTELPGPTVLPPDQ